MGRLANAIGVVLVVLAPAAPAQAASFFAGAGQQLTTPPAAGTDAGNAADQRFAPAFATACAGFPDRGRFALQEPFVDLNHNGQWDANSDLSGNPPSGPPEPYCDANGNGHWDGIYAPNGKGPANGVNDQLDVRAVAISDGHGKPVVYASVPQIGLFDFYTEDARALLKSTYGVDAELVVSANHNESSPDSIGLYGALQTPLGVGVRSGIDEYYMSYLDDRIAHAAADAVHSLQPADLFANQVEGQIPDGTAGDRYPLLGTMSERISDQFPTSVALKTDDRLAAADPKMGVLQARRPDGSPIFTVMSLAAHNQEMGNSGVAISADWPGAFEQAFDSSHAGMSMFLVGDNGSMEDPQSMPTVVDGGSENHSSVAAQYSQAQATGRRFADIAATAAQHASPLRPGAVKLTRRQVCVPLENNGFLALGASGTFGKRQGYACDQNGNPIAPLPNGFVAPTASPQFRTFVGFTDIGPDLQLVDNPGEAFPALMLGSPFGAEEASCNRPNPGVPAWHSPALYRFQVGLADDLIGYLIPAWGFASGTPGLFSNDGCYQDMNGHRHKLESESVGPTGSNIVANSLAAMLDAGKPASAQTRDPSAHVVQGARFVLPDGSYSRWPTGAVGILTPAAGGAALDPSGGTLVGSPTTAGFGNRAVDQTGLFMDYDGQPQGGPDVTTRGMIVLDGQGCVVARYYLDVFPPVDTSHKLGPSAGEAAVRPQATCAGQGAVPGIQPGAAARAGLRPAAGAGGGAGGGCADRTKPRSTIRRPVLRRGRLTVAGGSSDRSCGGRPGRVARVTVTVGRRVASGRCRFLGPDGRLGTTRSCTRGLQLLARGTSHWRLSMRARLPRGSYVLISRAVDTAGNTEPARRHGASVARLRG